MKRIFSLSIAFAMLFSLMLSVGAFAQAGATVKVNGSDVKADVQPFRDDGRVMIPVRAVFQALGAEVSWDEKENTAWIKKDKMSIQLPIGTSTAYIHREDDFTGIPEEVKLEVPTLTVNDRTFITPQLLTAYFNVNVNWNEETSTVGVDDKAQQSNPVNIQAENVKKIELFSLSQEKIKEYSEDEIGTIVSGLNSSVIDDSMYIMMLAGNNMVITMKDDSSIQLTSYGSKTNIVMNGQLDGKSVSYHLVCPDIAAILLDSSVK